MRKLGCAVFSTILLAGVISCRKAVETGDVAQIQTIPVTLSAGSDDVGKVVLGMGLSPQWEMDDSLAVFDGHQRNPFIVSEIDGKSAEFGGRVAEDATVLSAIYPYASAVSLDRNKLTLDFPDVQYIEQGDSSSRASLVCISRTTMSERKLDFRNIYALLKVDIDIEGVVSLRISGNSGENIAGRMSVDMESLSSMEFIDGKTAVSVYPSEGVFAKGSYYVAVPPVSFANGFRIEMARADGLTAVKSTENTLSLVRNRGVDLASITFKTKWKVGISTAEQLLKWNAGEKNRTDYDEVDILSDIDLAGADWVPTNFKGTFNGNGHKIYNFKVKNVQNCGFFALVSGAVKDLVIGSSDYDGKEGTWDGVTAFKHETTTITGWSYVGSIAARLDANSTISGCVNFAPVETGQGDTQKSCIGGIAGFCGSTGGNMKVENCINFGEVRNLALTSSVKNNSVGGITSKCEGETQILGCTNHGKITSSNPGVCYVGGIIGVGNGRLAAAVTGGLDYDVNVKSCVNTAPIVVNEGEKPSVGGIVGDLVSTHLDGCMNAGNLSSWAASELKIGGIAGKFELNRPSSIVNCTNGESGASSTKGTIATSTGTASAFIGGILGNIPAAATGTLTISGCKNYADISTDNPYAGNIGGFGSYWNALGCVVTVSDCDNYGNVSNTASSADAGDNRAGGFVGNFANGSGNASKFVNCRNFGDVTTAKARKTSAQIGGFCGTGNYIAFESCSNSGDISFSNALTATNAMNLGGIVGYGSNGITYTNCTNSGKIAVGESPSTGTGIAGGIVGYNIGGFIDNCDNSGTICVLNVFKGSANAGGIAGKLKDATIRNNSDNTGEVYSTVEGTATVGGILGTMQDAKITIDGSTNKGTVYVSKKAGQNLVGGIMGDGAALPADIKNCVNEGEVYATQTAYAKQYFTVGGIVGRTRGKNGALHTVTDCINRGTVTVTANTDNQLCNAGGIVGETNTWSKVTGNTNEATGTVICINNVEAGKTIRTAYAGGISGGDNESTTGTDGNDNVTDNVNYANVSATVTNGATAIGAGGVFGMLQRTGIFIGNKVYGTCSINSSGGVSYSGGAGAVMGYLAHPLMNGITAEVSKGITVNDVSYDDVKDMEGRLSAWLLPGNNGNVTATYVEAD